MRMARLTEVLSAQGKERVTPKTVAHLIRRADIQKAARMRFLFDVDFRDPSLYDVLINTAAVSREAAAKLIVDVARRSEFATTKTARRLVLDRVVGSQVEFALASHPDLRPHRIDVESNQGMVTPKVALGVDPDIAFTVASGVTGVQKVTLRIVETPVMSPFSG